MTDADEPVCPWKDVPAGALVWHFHHEKMLLEAAMEPLNMRAAFILSNKPEAERVTRLRLLRPVVHPEKMPAAVLAAYAARLQADTARLQAHAALSQAHAAWSQADAAWSQSHAAWSQAHAAWSQADAALSQAHAAWSQADAAWSQADEAWRKADAALSSAIIDNHSAIEALHREECPDCPWDGQTIFPIVDKGPEDHDA